MIPAHKNTKNPPGQIVNEPDIYDAVRDFRDLHAKDKNGVTKGFDRYPWLKTSSAPNPKKAWPFPPVNRPNSSPISPAKRLGDIIDRVVASSSEKLPKLTLEVNQAYEEGYKAGWNAAIEAVVKKQLDNF